MKLPLFVHTTASKATSPTVILGSGHWDIEQSHSDIEIYIYVNGSQHTDPTIIVEEGKCSKIYAEANNIKEYSLWACLQTS